MNLYLVQHAESTPKDENPDRPLSAQGKDDITRMAGWFAASNAPPPTQVLHSGKLRAQQTAQELAEALDLSEAVQPADGLAPLDPARIWVERLLQTGSDLMLVGHLPHLSRLSSVLLAGDEEAGVVRFHMGGVVCLRRDEDGAWSLAWMVIPDLIR